MEGFDTSTMTYMASAMSMPNTATPNGFHKTMLPLEMHDHLSNFEVNAFGGSEDVGYHPLAQQISPSVKRFSTTFDDPFSDVVSAIDNPVNDIQEGESPSIDRDNKLLSFSPATFEHVLLDYTYRQTTISLSAQLHGMFFLAESPWATSGDIVPTLNELTCYRRNLFQVTGNVTLPRTLRYILTEQGKQIPILSQELVISASESTEANAVKLISVPWKTPVNPTASTTVDDKVEREPPAIPLDLMNVQELDSDFANFPFQWKRLQFRIATANNGRRKELQQHFVVRLKVMATLATGGKIPICEVQSAAIIVRGRSPRNFQARKDMPLNGAGSHTRKSATIPTQPTRTSTGESSRKQQAELQTSALVKTEAQQPPMSVQSFFDPNDLQMPPDFFESFMANPGQQGAMTAIPQDPMSFDPLRGYPASSPDFARYQRPAPAAAAPINLSLVEDELPKPAESRLQSATPSKKVQLMTRPPSFTLNTMSSPGDESADLLYEYFPLGLDDWMPPVDAVYRPHVVHHINVSSDPRDPMSAPKSARRSKRYFSEDMG